MVAFANFDHANDGLFFIHFFENDFMRKCLVCKKNNPIHVKYCQHCGAYLPLEETKNSFDFLKAMILGWLFTAIFYVVFLPSVDHEYLQKLFQGSISQAILGLTLWSLFLIFFKLLSYRQQKRAYAAFLESQIHTLMSQGVYVKDVQDRIEELSQHLQKGKVTHFQTSLVFRRIRRIFLYLEAIPKKEEINDILDYQADIDYNRMENSYSILNVFIWAIPILGFIGTVFGIGEAIGEFSQFIRSMDSVSLGTQMRSALGGVTSGLSVAFNTTFLALVTVIPIMIGASLLRKAEEDLLLNIEEYCLEEVLPNLHVHPRDQEVDASYHEQLIKMTNLSDQWMKQLNPLIGALSQTSIGLESQVSGLQPIVKDFSESVFQVKSVTDAQVNANPERKEQESREDTQENRTTVESGESNLEEESGLSKEQIETTSSEDSLQATDDQSDIPESSNLPQSIESHEKKV